ncbi:MAG TPA: hypothetical protein DD657_09110 [Culturomica sp.]|nr:hypothetical protein [Culturomica sp.]
MLWKRDHKLRIVKNEMSLGMPKFYERPVDLNMWLFYKRLVSLGLSTFISIFAPLKYMLLHES